MICSAPESPATTTTTYLARMLLEYWQHIFSWFRTLQKYNFLLLIGDPHTVVQIHYPWKSLDRVSKGIYISSFSPPPSIPPKLFPRYLPIDVSIMEVWRSLSFFLCTFLNSAFFFLSFYCSLGLGIEDWSGSILAFPAIWFASWVARMTSFQATTMSLPRPCRGKCDDCWLH